MYDERHDEIQEDESSASRTLRIWLAVLTGVLTVILLYVSVQAVGSSWSPMKPGGMDGCVVNAQGRPVAGMVWVDEVSKSISDDGCFFFKHLAPGSHELKIETVYGPVMEQSFVVVSGEANSLGILTVP